MKLLASILLLINQRKLKPTAMKTITVILSIICSFLSTQIFAQADSLGLPGDNLNLYAVLDIFQKSKTLEDFEKTINLENSKVNNLDLNGDGQIDYIKVYDHVKGNSHAIVLQVSVTSKEVQDVAVIEVERDNNTVVSLQIIGDEALYGKNYIIEPIKNNSAQVTPNPGYTGGNYTNASGGNTNVTNVTNNYYNTGGNAYAYEEVGAWPIVLFMFTPTYRPYWSPYHWGYYPVYWRPWRPWFYHHYHEFHHEHHGYYHRSEHYRASTAHSNYESHRKISKTVETRRNTGKYLNTYKSMPGTQGNTKLNGHNKQNQNTNSTKELKQDQGHKINSTNNQNNGYKTVPANNQNSGYKTVPNNNQNSGYKTVPNNNQNSGYKTVPNNDQNSGHKTVPTNNQNSGYKTVPTNDQNSGHKTNPSNGQNSGYKTTPSNDQNNGNHSNNTYKTVPTNGQNNNYKQNPGNNQNNGYKTQPASNQNNGYKSQPGNNQNNAYKSQPGNKQGQGNNQHIKSNQEPSRKSAPSNVQQGNKQGSDNKQQPQNNQGGGKGERRHR